MSDGRYSQVENSNNKRLDELVGKLSTFRNINMDIGRQAESDLSLVDSMHNSVGALFTNIKNSSMRLTRSISAGNNIWKAVGLSLLFFFIIYNIFKLF
ncbi:HBR006Wp [Eremothecium sinecaudum]|uniref:HBR006Wp n=1 Tax=Eremothecium sinecaudum TaxID=45286 RepID=A0A109UXF0_9SACH|nr:HBR006Wp [Eremothecium sinecaudum]AMD18907.1 HBR006Wp [Eremothecium sinecaudum]